MKKIRMLAIAVLFLVIGGSPGWAATIELFDWAFNVDRVTYEDVLDDSMPTTGDLDDEGLGTLTWTTSAAGNHLFIAFFDHEIDTDSNTWNNEYGAISDPTTTNPAPGQSWEIDEPGWVFGDIYDNLIAGILDNSNASNANNTPGAWPDDVSWAMGWDFFLTAGETATISLFLGRDLPGTDFYLSQTDLNSTYTDQAGNVVPETIYFSSTLEITGTTTPVPEPGTLVLLGAGLLGFLGVNRKKKLYKAL